MIDRAKDSQGPMQSHADMGGRGSIRTEINMGTSPTHPEKDSQVDPSSPANFTVGEPFDYDPETQTFTPATGEAHVPANAMVTKIDHAAKTITVSQINDPTSVPVATTESGIEPPPSLPPHVVPLFESIDRHYTGEVQQAMRSELAYLCLTKWKARLRTWVVGHPLKPGQKPMPDHVPPIVFHSGGFAWVNRKERRNQR
jgi:hypothetical protein